MTETSGGSQGLVSVHVNVAVYGLYIPEAYASGGVPVTVNV